MSEDGGRSYSKLTTQHSRLQGLAQTNLKIHRDNKGASPCLVGRRRDQRSALKEQNRPLSPTAVREVLREEGFRGASSAVGFGTSQSSPAHHRAHCRCPESISGSAHVHDSLWWFVLIRSGFGAVTLRAVAHHPSLWPNRPVDFCSLVEWSDLKLRLTTYNGPTQP